MRSVARPRLRLRSKLSLLLGVIALAASLTLSVLTYYLARDALIDQRTSEAQQRAVANAFRIRDQLGTEDFAGFMTRLTADRGGFLQVILGNGDVYGVPLQLNTPDILPTSLRDSVDDGIAATQRFSIGDDRYVAVGVALPDGAEFYEALPLDGVEATLRRVLLLLVAGSAVAVLLAGAGGIWAGRRTLRPLGQVMDAAGHIAAGDLRTRVAPQTDADLEPLVEAFNGMADAVQQRIEREVRFASDVSHELRSPITALRAATDLIEKRRDELPDRTQQLVDVIVTQVRRFDGMVLDLLELARMDAGAADVHMEPADVAELARRAIGRLELDVPVEVYGDGSPPTAFVDRLRFDRILTNLLQNAGVHAGGATGVVVSTEVAPAIEGGGSRPAGQQEADFVTVAVDDDGPGVKPEEREQIFQRYTRGSESRHRVGTGLGLALVAEHARALGGEAWVEDGPGGGARFVVRLRRATDDTDDTDDDEPAGREAPNVDDAGTTSGEVR